MHPQIRVRFRFFGELNQFLLPSRKNRTFFHAVNGNPSIKDTIEALGIPHTEVGKMFVNNRPVGFTYQLYDRDKIKIYPQGVVQRKIRPKFILDVHLGKLVRHLRLLGFDSLYDSGFTDKQIIKIALQEKRIIFTRDICLLKNKIIKWGYWVRSVIAAQQIKEVIRKFALAKQIKPFRLCLECNGQIKQVPKAKIEAKLPLKVRQYYDKFYHCSACRKIYWQGSHYERLKKVIREAKKLS